MTTFGYISKYFCVEYEETDFIFQFLLKSTQTQKIKHLNRSPKSEDINDLKLIILVFFHDDHTYCRVDVF